MNKQEIFDKVVSHLRAQKKQALGSNYICAYRGVDGTKCAAGCLITDEVYEARVLGAELLRDCEELRADAQPVHGGLNEFGAIDLKRKKDF